MEIDKVKKPIRIAHILMALNISIFALVFIIDPKLSTSTLIQFGAKINYKIVEGEYWRLLTTMFLHANIPHLLFNMMALNIFSRDLEVIYGKKKFIAIYLISGFIGSFGSFVFDDNVAVGASGAIFGLLGANLYLFTINPEAYKKIYGSDILVLIGVNLVYGFMTPQIDNAAHLCGLVGGYFASWSLGMITEHWNAKKRLPFQATLLATILAFFLLAVPNYQNSWRYDLQKGIEYLNNGQLSAAKTYFIQGQVKEPSVHDFSVLLDFIDDYEKRLTESTSNQ
ncbi:MAG: rhomboid family intramembrane serine protease [Clostridia bacterium]|nr:rhomboid family intramembrane serine protease [Clostridia bacterium]